MKNVAFTAGLLVAGLIFTAQASAREGHALVQTVSGEAKMTVDGKKWIPLQVGALLKTGTTVKTSAEGRTDLFLGLNGSMLRLVGGTELTFSRLNIEESPIEPIAQTEMILKSGRAIGNVRKLPMGSSYVIKTPKGVAKVKGTVYDINAEGELVVVTGKVKYTDNANGKEVLIASGEKYSGGRELKATDDEKADAAAAAPPDAPVFPGFSIKVPLRQGVWETQRIAPTNFISPTPSFFGDLVIRSGIEFAADRLELNLDAATGSELAVGQELKPSDLQLSIGGGAISDDDAVIVVEEAIGGGKKLVVQSKTGEAFVPDDVVSASAVPVAVSIPTASGAKVDLDVDLVSKLEGPKVYIKTDETGVKSIEIKSDSFTKDEADAYLEEYKNQLGDLDNFNIDGLTSVDDLVIDAQIVETGDPLKPYRVVAEFTPSEGDTIKGVAEEVNITFVAPEAPDIEIPETFIPELEPPVVSPTVGS